MRLSESDFGNDYAGHTLCLKGHCNGITNYGNKVKSNVLSKYLYDLFFNSSCVYFDVIDMLMYGVYNGGKIMFRSTDYDISDDGVFCLFGEFVDMGGEKPHQTECTKRLESFAKEGRYELNVVGEHNGIYVDPDKVYDMFNPIKDIIVVMNPFAYAPYTVDLTCDTIVRNYPF